MDSINKILEQFWEANFQALSRPPTVWLAYSGGLDSHVLVHSLAGVRHVSDTCLTPSVKVVHINHNISPNSDMWEQHCRKVCENLNLPFYALSISLDLKSGESLEEQARNLRYAKLSSLMEDGDFLLTAHHQNDQAETFLLQLLRGAGVKGLSAMPECKKFGNGFQARPFLNCTREMLHEYAKHHELQWIDDESNLKTEFTRNYIRQELSPILKQRWPDFAANIARSASHCAEANELLEKIAAEDCVEATGQFPNTLSISKLNTLSGARQKNALRYFIVNNNVILPSTAKLQQMQLCILQSRSDKSPIVSWGDFELRRFKDDIFLLQTKDAVIPRSEVTINLQESTHDIPGFGQIQIVKTQGEGLNNKLKRLSLRFRKGGETLRLPNRKHHSDLKKLLQQWNVPPWQRDRIPLLFLEKQLIAVVGYATAHGFGCDDQNAMGYSIKFVNATC